MKKRQVQLPWAEGPDSDLETWSSPAVTARLLGQEEVAERAIPIEWTKCCVGRFLSLLDKMRKDWVGLTDDAGQYYLDWLLAACIARENVLLLGPPGTAKSEIASRFFQLLGLSPPRVHEQALVSMSDDISAVRKQWERRFEGGRQQASYFHYLLSRFTQPEELFGPVEISLLRQGILARVNFGLLTGPGVRAAFLDEIFKASSSILNTLLTLTQERCYFNWGGMEPADLLILIGASNEMPGWFAGSMAGVESGAEDFQTLYAFVDRFAIRLPIPMVSGTSSDNTLESDLAAAFGLAMGREARHFSRGHRFEQRSALACVNDALLLGRSCYQHESLGDGKRAGGQNAVSLFHDRQLRRFREAFLNIAAVLQNDNTNPAVGSVTWTISPRKLRALYKIALAHALIRDDNFLRDPKSAVVTTLGQEDLRILTLVWDSPTAASDLAKRVRALIYDFWKGHD